MVVQNKEHKLMPALHGDATEKTILILSMTLKEEQQPFPPHSSAQ